MTKLANPESAPDIAFLSLFDKDKAIEIAAQHLPFASSLTGSKFLNNDRLTIRRHWLKKYQQNVSCCQQKKEKETDNI